MLRIVFALSLLAALTTNAAAVQGTYVPPTQSDLNAYLGKLRQVQGAIAQVRISRFDPSPSLNYESTIWPRVLTETPGGCTLHHVWSSDQKVIAGLSHAILSSGLTPRRIRAANAFWGVQFFDGKHHELWALYLSQPRVGMSFTSMSFYTGDARLHDFLLAHFDEATKRSECKS